MTIQDEVAAARDLLERGDTHAARPLLIHATESAPTNVDARFWLGVCDQFDGYPDRAETAFRAVVAADPQHANGWYGLANLLESKGDKEGAQAMYYRAASEGSGPARAKMQQMGIQPPEKKSAETPPPPPSAAARPAAQAPQGARMSVAARASAAPVHPVDLRTLVPLGLRFAKGLATLVLSLALVVAVVVLVALIGAVVTEPTVDEEPFYLYMAALALVAIIESLRSVKRAGMPNLSGVVQGLAYRQESSGGYRGGHVVNVISFNLAVAGPEKRRVPLVAVEMRGRHMRGVLREGEDVEVSGVVKKGNYLQAKRVRILSTGEVVTARGATPRERLRPLASVLYIADHAHVKLPRPAH